MFDFQCAPASEYDLTETFNCYNKSERGLDLLRGHGDQTHSIDLSFVPSIEVNEVSFNWINSDDILNFAVSRTLITINSMSCCIIWKMNFARNIREYLTFRLRDVQSQRKAFLICYSIEFRKIN